MNRKDLNDLAELIVTEAKKRGATDCNVAISAGEEVNVGVRMGEVEELTGSQGRGLDFRAFVGKKSALTSTSDFRPEAIVQMVADTVAMAAATEEDEYAGLPEVEHFANPDAVPDLKMFDATIADLPIDRKIELALASEAAARSSDARITNSEGASFASERNVIVIANSRGFHGSYEGTACSLSASVVASEAGKVPWTSPLQCLRNLWHTRRLANAPTMQVGSWYHASRSLSGLESAEKIGKTAAQHALRQLGGRKVPSQEVPVVFDPQMASRLLGQFVGCAHGSHVYRNSSFLAGKLNEVVAASDLVIIDDGHIPGALGSRPFDIEGLPTTRRVIVENGRLLQYLVDAYAARRIGNGIKPNSGRTSNLFIKAGKVSPKDIIASVQNGLYLTNVSGPGFNAVTGDYSLGASGIWIENGELAYPVEQITVAGNVLEMFKSIEAIGNDLELRSSTSAPTIKIGKMMVSGS